MFGSMLTEAAGEFSGLCLQSCLLCPFKTVSFFTLQSGSLGWCAWNASNWPTLSGEKSSVDVIRWSRLSGGL